MFRSAFDRIVHMRIIDQLAQEIYPLSDFFLKSFKTGTFYLFLFRSLAK